MLEDRFPHGRPPLERAGVQLVDDVAPYELVKLRLLNAGHQALAHLGALAGHVHADEATADPALAAFVLAYMEREATPTLAPVPGLDLPAYRRTLLERFGNRHVRDTLDRLRAEASDRIPAFLLPVVREQLAAGRSIAHCALVVAAWARTLEGVDDAGRPLAVVDRRLEAVQEAAASRDTGRFLRRTGVFGELADDPHVVAEVDRQRAALRAHGALGAVRALRDEG